MNVNLILFGNNINSHPLMSYCWEHIDIIFTYNDSLPWASFLKTTKEHELQLTVMWPVKLDNMTFTSKVRFAIKPLLGEGISIDLPLMLALCHSG